MLIEVKVQTDVFALPL